MRSGNLWVPADVSGVVSVPRPTLNCTRFEKGGWAAVAVQAHCMGADFYGYNTGTGSRCLIALITVRMMMLMKMGVVDAAAAV